MTAFEEMGYSGQALVLKFWEFPSLYACAKLVLSEMLLGDFVEMKSISVNYFRVVIIILKLFWQITKSFYERIQTDQSYK